MAIMGIVYCIWAREEENTLRPNSAALRMRESEMEMDGNQRPKSETDRGLE